MDVWEWMRDKSSLSFRWGEATDEPKFMFILRAKSSTGLGHQSTYPLCHLSIDPFIHQSSHPVIQSSGLWVLFGLPS